MGRKIAVYCRISTGSDQQQNSLLNQKLLFQPKIEADGDELYRIFYDEGLTGTKLNNRDGFNEMLTLAGIDVIEQYDKKLLPNGNYDSRVKRKTTVYVESDRKACFDRIYIKNTSRFARNVLSYDIVTKLRSKGVYIYFLEQNIDTENRALDMQLQLFQVIDQNDSRDKSIKVSTGIRKSAERGVIRTNSSIYGYNYIKATNSLEIIDSEADTVRRIYSLYLQGLGTRRIIKVLNDEKRFTRSGKSFGVTSIRRILQNEKYYGGLAILKWDTGRVFEKRSHAVIRDNYDVVMSPRIEPIITKDTFELAQKIMQGKVKEGMAVYVGTSKFSGKIVCSRCGCHYISDKEKRATGNIYEYYRCFGKKSKGVNFCNNSNITKQQLEDMLQVDIANKQLEHKYELAIKSIKQQLEHLRDIYKKDNTGELLTLENQLEELKNATKTAFHEFANKRLPEFLYTSIIEENTVKMQELEQRINDLKRPVELFEERRDILLAREQKYTRELRRGLTELDYLEHLEVRVLRDGTPLFSYNVQEFEDEMTNLVKIINEKAGLK